MKRKKNFKFNLYLFLIIGLICQSECTVPIQSDDNPEVISGSEIALNMDYWNCVDVEPDLDKQDILLSITRNYDLMEFNNPKPLLAYMLAVLTDSATLEIVGAISNEILDLRSTPERVTAINEYTSTYFTHTQTEAMFAEIPWHDPWGLDLPSGQPRYKKLLPTEMRAMSELTGKISGKCMTLAHLLTGIFYWLGSDQDDIMIFVTQSPGYRHANAMLMYEDSLIFTNNQYLALASDYPDGSIPGPISILGIYNHEKTINWEYTIQDYLSVNAFIGPESAMEMFCNNFNVPLQCISRPYQLEHFHGRRELLDEIYCNRLNSELAFLSKYAAQSLYVKLPEYYLQASLLCSGPKDLAKTLSSPAELFLWMADNLGSTSIFPEPYDHIMTADQVQTFQTGGFKDQAVLAFTVLTHMGYKPLLYLTANDAYLAIDEDTLSVRNWEKVNQIQDQVVFGPLTI